MSGRRFHTTRSRVLGGMGDIVQTPGSARQARRAQAAVARSASGKKAQRMPIESTTVDGKDLLNIESAESTGDPRSEPASGMEDS